MKLHARLCRACRPPIVLFLLAPMGLSAQTPQVAGCYDVELGAWAPEMALGVDSIYMAPPPRIQLKLDSIRGGRVLAVAPGALPSVHRFSFWRSVEPDSVLLIWSSGYSGLRMHLAVSEQALRGYAETFWDFGRAPQTAAATARPVSCEAPLKEEDRFAYHLPRGVELEGGDSLRIGEVLPDGVSLVEGRRGSYRVYGSPTAPFSGAEQVWVLVNTAGVVRRIMVYFRNDVSHQAVLDALIPIAGEPTTRSVREQSDGSVIRHAIWSDRLMEVRLVATGRESEPLQLLITDRREW